MPTFVVFDDDFRHLRVQAVGCKPLEQQQLPGSDKADVAPLGEVSVPGAGKKENLLERSHQALRKRPELTRDTVT